MTTILTTTFTAFAVILPAIAIAIVSKAAVRKTQTLMASLGWQRLASVSWNG
jgi:hypothetical protein